MRLYHGMRVKLKSYDVVIMSNVGPYINRDMEGNFGKFVTVDKDLDQENDMYDGLFTIKEDDINGWVYHKRWIRDIYTMPEELFEMQI